MFSTECFIFDIDMCEVIEIDTRDIVHRYANDDGTDLLENMDGMYFHVFRDQLNNNSIEIPLTVTVRRKN